MAAVAILLWLLAAVPVGIVVGRAIGRGLTIVDDAHDVLGDEERAAMNRHPSRVRCPDFVPGEWSA